MVVLMSAWVKLMPVPVTETPNEKPPMVTEPGPVFWRITSRLLLLLGALATADSATMIRSARPLAVRVRPSRVASRSGSRGRRRRGKRAVWRFMKNSKFKSDLAEKVVSSIPWAYLVPKER